MTCYRWLDFFPALILASLLLASCSPESEQLPPAPEPETYVRPEPNPTIKPKPSHVRFTDITRQSGIHFVHQNGYSGQKYLPETLGSGGGFFDYNNDGHLDVFLVNARYFDREHTNEPPSYCALYRGDGQGNFSDVTEEAGLKISLYGMGCAMADFDGDSDEDLFITAALDGQRFYRNNGNGTYTDITQSSGLTAPSWQDEKGNSHPYWSTGAAFFDYDRDGWLDLVVVNYVQWSIENDIFTTRVGLGKSFTTPDLYKGLSPLLYRNNGDGTYTDVSQEAHVWNPEGKSLGVAMADLNDDGWLDFAVSNDTQPNFLYINQQDGTFLETGLTAGIAFDENGRARAGMGIDIAPGFNDRQTIAIGNFSHEPISLYTLQSKLFFTDAAGRARITRPTLLPLTFGLSFFDYDLDGWLDMALANGHIEPDINQAEKEVYFEQSPQLFRGVDGKTFQETSEQVGDGLSEPLVGRGLAYGDIDGDGDLDLLITGCGGPPRLLRNDGVLSNNFIRLKLVGKEPNTNAIGAQITIQTGGRPQTRTIRTGSSYLSQSEQTATFGLGQAEEITAIQITWPLGKTQEIHPIPSINQTHIIKQ